MILNQFFVHQTYTLCFDGGPDLGAGVVIVLGVFYRISLPSPLESVCPLIVRQGIYKHRMAAQIGDFIDAFGQRRGANREHPVLGQLLAEQAVPLTIAQPDAGVDIDFYREVHIAIGRG